MKKPRKPEFFITYLCKKCGFDFAMTDWDKPRCFYCESTRDWKILKKEKFSWAKVTARLKLVNDRMMEALGKGYEAGMREKSIPDETELLEVMARAERLGKNIKAMTKTVRKK